MTVGLALFIIGIMPFTIVGMLVVSIRISKLFDKKHKEIEKEE